MTKKQELAVKEEQEQALALYGNDGDTGFEEADSDAFSLPFLKLLQGLSPQLQKNKPEFIKGAASGDFVNAATGEVFTEGFEIIPCHYRQVFTEWRPNNGGLAGEHSAAGGKRLLATCTKGGNNGFDEILPNGNELIDTRTFYVLIYHEDEHGARVEPAVIALVKTQIKHGRKWMNRMNALRIGSHKAPMWSHRYKISAGTEEKDGNSWNCWVFGEATLVTDADIVDAANAYRQMIMAGTAKVQHEDPTTSEVGDEVDF